jgi:hypothetical protein
MKKTAIITSLALALVSTSLTVSANQSLNDSIAFRIGPFFPSIDTSVTIGNETQNFEDYLDDSSTTFAIKGIWRFHKNFRLNFGYWNVDRDDSIATDQRQVIDGIPIPVGTSLTASFDSSVANANLGWSFISNESTEFGADLGLAALGLKSELVASVPPIGPVASYTAFDETYILPIIGMYWDQALSPMWSIGFRLSGMGLDLGDDFKGTIIDAMAALELRPWENIGFGAAYLYNDADAELKNVGDGLDVKWNYSGPFAYIVVGGGDKN